MFPGVCIAIPHRRDNGKQFSMHRSVLMEPRTLQYMAEACGGERLSGRPELRVHRVCTDSRQVQARDLFVPLTGDRFDGHSFLTDAVRKGAVAALVERARLAQPWPDCGLVAVDRTRVAFGQMAARYRRDFTLPVVAVAGSNGKTTTKELLGAVLRQKFRTLASRASFNNDVGVPTTLLDLQRDHEVAVLEFGTNHPGELAPLLKLAKPQFGVLTSIGREHLEFFQDLNGVLQEEAWLAALLPPDGRLFVNGDTLGASQISERSPAPVTRVGFAADNHWRARNERTGQSGVTFLVETTAPGFSREFRVPLLGRHQVRNALLALAVGAELGLSADEAQRGLTACSPAKMRLQPWSLGEIQILDDSYNANADSMRAALETLHDYPCRGRRVAVLGDMAELGEHSNEAHVEIGRYAASLGVQLLVAVGKMAPVLVEAAREAGLQGVQVCSDTTAAAGWLREVLRPGDVVLLKASRATGLEKVGEELRRLCGVDSKNDFGQGPNPLGWG
jgi:UDP-N-acetylmuramoyl-tripeptide--D-alanyl-D-alanine ligase